MKTFKATRNDSGRTLLKFIQRMMNNLPKSRVEKLFRKKDIKVNGKRTNEKQLVIKIGDVIDVYGVYDFAKEKEIVKVPIEFAVIYEDKHILIVEKKPWVEVHGSETCLDNQVLTYLNFKPKDSFIPSHVGRLDKVTSGIMLYAKTYESLTQLNVSNNSFKKIYTLKSDLPESIETKFRIDHDEDLQRQVVVKKGGKVSHSIFTVNGNNISAEIKTGRKHQIRVSLSKLGFPIYGDRKYGGKPESRVFLHAMNLTLNGLEKELNYLNGQEFISFPKWK
ncbi:MAG: RluA family pseudouridine synthase [Mollicutes bacterium PWAP]|nr:RluA family pseudouridine synthase [Mollicutes bacterium PWAP]